jgi:signal transduction histidine kinase
VQTSETKHTETTPFRLLLSAVDLERSRLGRRLHDTVAQNLAAISMRLSMIPATGNEKIDDLLAECGALVAESIAEVRAESYYLHPALIEDLGIKPALLTFSKSFPRNCGAQLNVTAREGAWVRFAPAQELSFFRMVHDASVAIAAGGAKSVKVKLACAGPRISAGISGETTMRRPEKALLRFVLSQRARQCGGEAAVRYAGEKAAIRLSVPLEVRT